MIPDSIDISSGVSSNLAALIESRVNDPDAEEPVTLGSVRHTLLLAAFGGRGRKIASFRH